jgi:hypothetical protein
MDVNSNNLVTKNPITPQKRPPGRPKGLGRVPGSGRKPGTPNKLTQDVRQYIMDKGQPLELLFKIARGHKIKVGDAEGNAAKIYPSLTDRASAARALLAKCLPDMKATEVSSPDGGPLTNNTQVNVNATPKEMVRTIAAAFAKVANERRS